MLIGIIDYYTLYFKSNSDEIREDGNLRLLELYNLGKTKNIFFEKYNRDNHAKYNLVIFANEPRIIPIILFTLRNLFIKKIDIFYMGDETPICRPRRSLVIPKFYKKILINSIGSKKLEKKKNYFLYTSASIPSKETIIKKKEFILKNNRNKLLCYVGSNILCLSNKGTYKFRNNIVRALCKFKNFSLYGKDWDKEVIPIDFPLYALIIKIKFLKKLIASFYKKKYPKILSKGTVKNKINTINNYNFTLAIEPYIGEPKMLLEKIFDPMLAGSIPVYYGPKNIDIPKDIFIRIEKNTNPKDLINYLNSFSENQLNQYRIRIYEYLISDKSNKYRYSYFANKILDLLKKENLTNNIFIN